MQSFQKPSEYRKAQGEADSRFSASLLFLDPDPESVSEFDSSHVLWRFMQLAAAGKRADPQSDRTSKKNHQCFSKNFNKYKCI